MPCFIYIVLISQKKQLTHTLRIHPVTSALHLLAMEEGDAILLISPWLIVYTHAYIFTTYGDHFYAPSKITNQPKRLQPSVSESLQTI